MEMHLWIMCNSFGYPIWPLAAEHHTLDFMLRNNLGSLWDGQKERGWRPVKFGRATTREDIIRKDITEVIWEN